MHQRLHCCHLVPVQHAPSLLEFTQFVSLASVLSASSTTTDRSSKLPLVPRLFLALTLASTFIQLHATPWLDNIWSKHSIYFSVRASNNPRLDKRPLHPSSIDLARPILSRSFNNSSTSPNLINNPKPQRTEPQQMILELGIMLLELWHETSLECRSSMTNCVVNDSYYDRLAFAQRWLVETEDFISPVYFQVVSRCVRCCFDGVPPAPVWDGCLLKGLVIGVVEPLLEQCRPSFR